jgi:hypothetical protein
MFRATRHMKGNQRQGGEVCVWRALRVGGIRWGVLRGGRTTPTGELLNKHTAVNVPAVRRGCASGAAPRVGRFLNPPVLHRVSELPPCLRQRDKSVVYSRMHPKHDSLNFWKAGPSISQ